MGVALHFQVVIMDPLDKLEIIVKARIAEIWKEYEILEGKHSQLYLESLDHGCTRYAGYGQGLTPSGKKPQVCQMR